MFIQKHFFLTIYKKNKMKILFYKIPTAPVTVYGLHWFYAKKNQYEEFIPPTGVTSFQFSEWKLNFDLPLPLSEVGENLKKSYYFGQRFGKSMYDSTYFYDPIHGYCNCNSLCHRVSNTSYHYLNQLRLRGGNYQRKLIFNRCQCFQDLFFDGKDFFTVDHDIYGERLKKYAPFKEQFQWVIDVKEVDFLNVGCCTHYLVISINLMNVKQVEPGVFEVGLCYEFIQDSYRDQLFFDLEMNLYPVGKVNQFFNDLSHIAHNFFEQDQKNYYEYCCSIIEYLLHNNLLPSSELYVHVFTDSCNYKKEWNEGYRFYIKQSDFNLILSNKKRETKEKKEIKKWISRKIENIYVSLLVFWRFISYIYMSN